MGTGNLVGLKKNRSWISWDLLLITYFCFLLTRKVYSLRGLLVFLEPDAGAELGPKPEIYLYALNWQSNFHSMSRSSGKHFKGVIAL